MTWNHPESQKPLSEPTVVSEALGYDTFNGVMWGKSPLCESAFLPLENGVDKMTSKTLCHLSVQGICGPPLRMEVAENDTYLYRCWHIRESALLEQILAIRFLSNG